MSTCLLCNSDVDPSTALAWRKDGYDIVRCPSCGLVYREELPDEEALAVIYDEGYFHDSPETRDRHGYADYLGDAELHRANARRRLRPLVARTPGLGRLLDVGCAAGFFVDYARRRGWKASGIDVSRAMVEHARELGVDVQLGSFTHTELGLTELDAITMWDYIEHSTDPRRDLENAHAYLRSGGVLALSTGDVDSLSARLAGSRWHLLTPEHHNFFFSVSTLGRLLAETGFDVVEARHRGSLYSPVHVLYKLATSSSLLRVASARFAGSRVATARIPLNLYDIVTVLAVRR